MVSKVLVWRNSAFRVPFAPVHSNNGHRGTYSAATIVLSGLRCPIEVLVESLGALSESDFERDLLTVADNFHLDRIPGFVFEERL